MKVTGQRVVTHSRESPEVEERRRMGPKGTTDQDPNSWIPTNPPGCKNKTPKVPPEQSRGLEETRGTPGTVPWARLPPAKAHG